VRAARRIVVARAQTWRPIRRIAERVVTSAQRDRPAQEEPVPARILAPMASRTAMRPILIAAAELVRPARQARRAATMSIARPVSSALDTSAPRARPVNADAMAVASMFKLILETAEPAEWFADLFQTPLLLASAELATSKHATQVSPIAMDSMPTGARCMSRLIRTTAAIAASFAGMARPARTARACPLFLLARCLMTVRLPAMNALRRPVSVAPAARRISATTMYCRQDKRQATARCSSAMAMVESSPSMTIPMCRATTTYAPLVSVQTVRHLIPRLHSARLAVPPPASRQPLRSNRRPVMEREFVSPGRRSVAHRKRHAPGTAFVHSRRASFRPVRLIVR
jgi:hypothetical protein